MTEEDIECRYNYVIAVIILAILFGLVCFLCLSQKTKVRYVSENKIAQIHLWEIVAGERPIPNSPEGDLARDIRTVYLDLSSPTDRLTSLRRLANGKYPGIVIAQPVYYTRDEGIWVFDISEVNSRIAKILKTQSEKKPQKEETQ